MIRAFLLAIGQLGDRPILVVLLKSLLLTLIVLATAGVGLWFGVRALTAAWFDASGSALAATLAVIASLAIAWVIFRAVAIAVVGLFGDQIVVAVEAKHYPARLATARNVPFARALAIGLGSAGRALLVNLILVPAYILLLVTGVGAPALFFVANGWLLGRDLTDMVAARHTDGAAMKAWRKESAFSRFGLGLIVTFMLSVPGLNLVAPVLGAAMATHLFHGRKT
jgi:CysZ protein